VHTTVVIMNKVAVAAFAQKGQEDKEKTGEGGARSRSRSP
jgi:hypothetical protein